MRRVWLRVSLVIVMFVVTVASGYKIFLIEQDINYARNNERAFSIQAWRLSIFLSDFRASQHAYVAAGQDRNYWVAKTAEQLDTISENLADLTGLSKVPDTVSALEMASSSIEDIRRMDALAREHSSSGENLIASDLIFTDGLELANGAVDHIERARTVEQISRETLIKRLRQAQMMTFAPGVGTGLFIALLLAPLPRSVKTKTNEIDAAASVSATKAQNAEPHAETLSLNLSVEPDRMDLADVPETPTTKETIPETTILLDFPAAASLCTDLGRLSDSAELPDLLARAAALLNAKGLIVWLHDENNSCLLPAVEYGYGASSIAQLGAIPSDSENATAAAFRDLRMHIVSAEPSETGAVVAPLISAVDCIGVLSAELREGWEVSETVQSAVAIIAAQLSTLVATSPATQTKTAQA